MTPLKAIETRGSWNGDLSPAARQRLDNVFAETMAIMTDSVSLHESGSGSGVHDWGYSIPTHDEAQSGRPPVLHTKMLVIDLPVPGDSFWNSGVALQGEGQGAGRRLEDELAWIREAAAPTTQAAPILIEADVVVIGAICLDRR